jgi:enoyl-CoA hydratase/carnithine racemase
MARDSLLFEVTDDGVAVLTLNRPERHNAWNMEMEAEFFGRLAECDGRADVKVIVVTGAGSVFCVGADMEILKELSNDKPVTPAERIDAYIPSRLSKPIIAAINGACAGRGLVQALYCDIRFSVRSAKYATSFARRGLPAEYGLAWLLPRLVGMGSALDLLLSGRTIMADEAKDMGLIHRIVDEGSVLDYALAYATDLATNCSPTSMAAIKRQVWTQLEYRFELAYEEAKQLMTQAIRSHDFAEGVTSFTERRKPEFDTAIAPWALGR